MPFEIRKHSSCVTGQAGFDSTHWSTILSARSPDSAEAAGALEQLCRTYWFPIYAYMRREGHEEEEARDLTQEFFARLFVSHIIASAVPERGRFRSFLLVAVKRFLVNEWHKARCLKRGGDRRIVPLDWTPAEDRYRLEPVDELTAERIYERQWALSLLDRVLTRLEQEAVAAEKGRHFALLKPFLYGEQPAATQGELAERLGMTRSAVKSAVHRLRQRYRELLRIEVAQTVSCAAEAEDELRHLLTVLRS